MAKFIFIGGTYRGFKLLESLIKKNELPRYIVILKEDSHEIEKYSEDMIVLATSYSIPYSHKKKLDNSDAEIIKNEFWDFAIVCGWRTIIPFDLDKFFRYGLLAAHDSLLPKYRGFSPLNWAIINGEKKTGVTLFKINDGEVDSGDILEQEEVEIGVDEYAIDIYQKITIATIKVYLLFIEKLKMNKIDYKIQNEEDATYTCKRGPQDGKINWCQSSLNIFNFIRALAHPYPGAFCSYDNKIYHIRKASLGTNNSKTFAGRIIGKVITVNHEYIEVLCEEGSINIYLWEDKMEEKIEVPSKIVKSINAVLV